MSSFLDETARVRSLLDRDGWKHTWHLERDEYGRIDWRHPDNLRLVRRELNFALGHGVWLAHEALSLITLLDDFEKGRESCVSLPHPTHTEADVSSTK